MGIDVRIEQLPIAQGLQVPSYASAGAAGLDLIAAVDADQPLVLHAGDRVRVPTGLKLAIPQGYEGQVRARSGLALNHGIIVPNAPGTIDCDYRGELQVILANISQQSFSIERGMRIAQLIFAAIAHVTWNVGPVGQLETQRGANGFGSSGLGVQQIISGELE